MQSRKELLEFFVKVQEPVVARYERMERRGILLALAPKKMTFFSKLLPKKIQERILDGICRDIYRKNAVDISRNKVLLKSQLDAVRQCIAKDDDQSIAAWIENTRQQLKEIFSNDQLQYTVSATWNVRWIIGQIEGAGSIHPV